MNADPAGTPGAGAHLARSYGRALTAAGALALEGLRGLLKQRDSPTFGVSSAPHRRASGLRLAAGSLGYEWANGASPAALPSPTLFTACHQLEEVGLYPSYLFLFFCFFFKDSKYIAQLSQEGLALHQELPVPAVEGTELSVSLC